MLGSWQLCLAVSLSSVTLELLSAFPLLAIWLEEGGSVDLKAAGSNLVHSPYLKGRGYRCAGHLEPFASKNLPPLYFFCC